MSTIAEYLESLRGKSVAVIGMGVSNTPLIRMMLRAGLKVTVCDKSPRERVEELAAELGVSKSHLVRVFHQTLGVTPGRYLTDTRVEAARQLLARGHSLEVVATLCGFSGANYLCKVFKKVTGMSPAQFRSTVQPAPLPQTLADAAEEGLFL